jgi:hypothetical protein
MGRRNFLKSENRPAAYILEVEAEGLFDGKLIKPLEENHI